MKFSRISLLILIVLALTFQSCGKNDPEIDNANDFRLYLENEMEDQHIPAISALIFKEDFVLLEENLGQSNIDQNIALQADHLFLLASVSKVITATALLRLYDQGEFALNDPINNYLPFSVQIPGYSNDITFKMLLTHTSGIADGPSLDGQYYYGTDSPVPLSVFLESYLVPGGSNYDEFDNFYDFSPGSEHEYSNIGNALIGLLVEEISGTDFNTFCKQQIFGPLGMTNTFWRLDEISQTIVQPYNYVSRDFEEIEHYTFTDYPNGGLRSNARDLFTFLSTIAAGGSTNSYSLLNTSTVNLMQSAQISTIDNTVGLHLFQMNVKNNLWGHDGGEQGVATIMAYNPDDRIGAIILANQGEADLEQILEEAYILGTKL